MNIPLELDRWTNMVGHEGAQGGTGGRGRVILPGGERVLRPGEPGYVPRLRPGDPGYDPRVLQPGDPGYYDPRCGHQAAHSASAVGWFVSQIRTCNSSPLWMLHGAAVGEPDQHPRQLLRLLPRHHPQRDGGGLRGLQRSVCHQ